MDVPQAADTSMTGTTKAPAMDTSGSANVDVITSTNENDAKPKKVAFGSVGFKFHKYFPNYGWFQGTVVEIRPTAAKGRSRRVLYEDGDSEDLSIKEIRVATGSYKRFQRRKRQEEQRRQSAPARLAAAELVSSASPPSEKSPSASKAASTPLPLPWPLMMQVSQTYTNISSPTKSQTQGSAHSSNPTTPNSGSRRPIIQHRHNTRHQHKQVEQFLKETSPAADPVINPLQKLAVAASERVEETAAARQILQMTATTSTTNAQEMGLGTLQTATQKPPKQPKHAEQETTAAQQMLEMSVARLGPVLTTTAQQPKQIKAPVVINTLPPPQKVSSSSPTQKLPQLEKEKASPTAQKEKSPSPPKQQTIVKPVKQTPQQHQVKETSTSDKLQVQQVKESRPTPPHSKEKQSSSPPNQQKVSAKDVPSQKLHSKEMTKASSNKEDEKEKLPPVPKQKKVVEPVQNSQKSPREPQQGKITNKQGLPPPMTSDKPSTSEERSSATKKLSTSKAMEKSIQASAQQKAKQPIKKSQQAKTAGSSTEKSPLRQKDNEEVNDKSPTMSKEGKSAKKAGEDAMGKLVQPAENSSSQKNKEVKDSPLGSYKQLPQPKRLEETKSVLQSSSPKKSLQLKAAGGQAKDRPQDVTEPIPKAGQMPRSSSEQDEKTTPVAQNQSQLPKEQVASTQRKSLDTNRQKGVMKNPPLSLWGFKYNIVSKKKVAPSNKSTKNQIEKVGQTRKEQPSSSKKEEKVAARPVKNTQAAPQQEKTLSVQKKSSAVTKKQAKVKPSQNQLKKAEVGSTKELEGPQQQQPPNRKHDITQRKEKGVVKTPHVVQIRKLEPKHQEAQKDSRSMKATKPQESKVDETQKQPTSDKEKGKSVTKPQESKVDETQKQPTPHKEKEKLVTKPQESKVDETQKPPTPQKDKEKLVPESKLKQGGKGKARESAQDEQPPRAAPQQKKKQAKSGQVQAQPMTKHQKQKALSKKIQTQQPRSEKKKHTEQPSKSKQSPEQESSMIEAVRQASQKTQAGWKYEEKSAESSQKKKVTKPQHEELKSAQHRPKPKQQTGGDGKMQEMPLAESSSWSEQKQQSSSMKIRLEEKQSAPKPQSQKHNKMRHKKTVVDESSTIAYSGQTQKNEETISVKHKAMKKQKATVKHLSKPSSEQHQQTDGKENSPSSKPQSSEQQQQTDEKEKIPSSTPQHQIMSTMDQEKPRQKLFREKSDRAENKKRETTQDSQGKGRLLGVHEGARKQDLSQQKKNSETTQRLTLKDQRRSQMEERQMKGQEGFRKIDDKVQKNQARQYPVAEKIQQKNERSSRDGGRQYENHDTRDKVEEETIAIDKRASEKEGSKSSLQHNHYTRQKHIREDKAVERHLNEGRFQEQEEMSRVIRSNRGIHDVAIPIVHGLRKKPASKELEIKTSSERTNDDRSNRKRKASSILTPSELYATIIKDSAESATAMAVMKLRRATLNVERRRRGKGRAKKKRRRSKTLAVSDTTKKFLIGEKVAINPMISSPESSLLIDLSFDMDDSSPTLSGAKSSIRANMDKPHSSSKAQSSSSLLSSAKQDQISLLQASSANSHSPKIEGLKSFAAKSNFTSASAVKEIVPESSASIHVEGSASSQSSKKLKHSTRISTAFLASVAAFKSPASIVGSASSQTFQKQSTLKVPSVSVATSETLASSKTTSNNQPRRKNHSTSLLPTSISEPLPTLPAKKRAARMGLEPTQVSKKRKLASPVSEPDPNVIANDSSTLPPSKIGDQPSSILTSHSSSLPLESNSLNEAEIGESSVHGYHLTKDDSSKSSHPTRGEDKEELTLKPQLSESSTFVSNPSDISRHFTQWQNKLRQRKAENINGVEAAQSDGSTCNSNSNLRRSSRRRPEEVEVPVGQVGFKFEKFFPGHGLFNGMVVEIIGPMRRCTYSDGDQEDLTLGQLKGLVKAKERRIIQASEKKMAALTNSGKSNNNVRSAPKQSKVSSSSSSNSEQSDYENEFDKADQIIPSDEAAAMTLHERTKNNPIVKNLASESGDPQWLKEVATLLKTKEKGSKKKSKKIVVGDGCNDVENMDASSYGNEVNTLKPSDVVRPTPLIHVRKGHRHGCKVVNMNDEKRIVGQVLLEHHSGWIEVVFDSETKKDRTSNYIAVPENYDIGKCASDLKILKRQISNRPLEQDKCRPASSEVKINVESVFYWYCKACKVPNSFLQQDCKICCEKRHSNTCAVSPLLELAENVCAVHDNEDAIQTIPHLHRRSIPKDVLKIIQESRKVAMQGGSKKYTLPMPAPLNPDTLFYWRCTQCTMDNSYKRWSCSTCKKKKGKARESLLLEVAYGVAKDALTVEDAMNKIPDIHKSAIPAGVMRSLVTCIAIVPKTSCRCQNPKLHNSDYCSSHRKAIALATESTEPQLSANKADLEEKKIKSSTGEQRTETFLPIDRLVQNIRSKLRETRCNQENARGWEIQSIEDAFLCEQNEPFPLGLKVRRYFPGHGYHDGEITDANRKQLLEEENSRPVLVYRVKYNDGDEEDLLHHEINSLRQIYDVRSVRPTAPTSEQITTGTKFETLIGNSIVEVRHIRANQNDINDRGVVYARVEKPNETVKDIEIELTKLQVAVVRRVTPYCGPTRKSIAHWLFPTGVPTNQLSTDTQSKRPPFLEWPPPPVSNGSAKTGASDTNDGEDSVCLSFPGLTLHPTAFHEYPEDSNGPELVGDNVGATQNARVAEENTCHTRSGVPKYGHDPAGAYRYLTYNPYESTKCEICKSGKDGHHILICDDCDKGYHTYCLRPVVVNIPRDEWSCPTCSPVRQVTFGSIMEKLKSNPKDVMSFLGLPLESTEDFCKNHKSVYELLRNRKEWKKRFAKKKIAEIVDGIAVSRNRDKQLLILPEPMDDPDKMMHSLTSIVASCKYCGMETYSESLAYEKRLTESNNDSSLDKDTVTPLSKLNSKIFQHYKENLKNGVFPPVEVVYDGNIGFLVKTLAPMKKHTILTEYVGEVTTIDQTGNTSSDSLMSLLQTGDDSTSLTIDPSRIGNIARFFSGINNRNLMSKKRANVRTRRFVMDGKCKVFLFTARDVDAGDILHYDYNAGIEGKSVGEIVKSGFYDTSNFL